MTPSTSEGGTAPVQGRLWSARARAWAEVQEATVLPLFDAIADRLGIGAGTRMLDVGCGEPQARGAVLAAVAPYRTPAGAYRFHNVFRYAVAVR